MSRRRRRRRDRRRRPPVIDGGIEYLLRATFNAADQGYADAQVLDTSLEGIRDGQLTVVEVDGTLAIVSNKCAFTAPGTTWGKQAFYGGRASDGAIARALGRGLLATYNITTKQGLDLALNSDATVRSPANAQVIYAHHFDTSKLSAYLTGSGRIVASSYSTSTDYSLAIVLGGYDSNGVPWRRGQAAASYLYGAAFYIKGGTFTTWTLLWRASGDNTATLYASLSNYGAAGTFNDILVPDVDLSAVLQPTCLSTFAAANSTSLDAITPEVGGVWTEESGDWDIQSNEASPPSSGNSEATVDASISDAIVDCDATAAYTDASNYVKSGLVLRWSDGTHFWLLQIQPQDNKLNLLENDAGWTSRASAAVTISDGVTYAVRAILDGQTIDGFADGGNKISYASATFNETETEHGLRTAVTGTDQATFDDFAIYPRTAAIYDTALDAV